MENSKTILVTGGAGYIGSHTILDLMEFGFDKIISVDDYSNSSEKTYDRIKNISQREVMYYECDLVDIQSCKRIFKEHKIDSVIHFAAHKAVGESVDFPLKYYKNNLDSLFNLLTCCEEFKVNEFIFSSSCTVYGNPDSIPVSENSPIQNAQSPYGNTKRISEEVIMDFAKRNPWFKATLLRYFNPVGAHMSGKIGELPLGVPNNLVPFITQTAIGKREELTVFGGDYDTRDGSCIRDYIHVMDIARAHTLALDKIDDLNKSEQVRIYNLGTGNGVSVFEVIDAFENSTGVKLNFKVGPRRSGDVPAVYSDSTLAYNELGWEIRYSIEQMMSSAWLWEQELAKEND